MTSQLSREDVLVPADVANSNVSTYIRNYLTATCGTGRLMLFAGDQKIEHMNDDFAGISPIGTIPDEDGDPEHLFRIASQGQIGVFATQQGLASLYGRRYPHVPYLIKVNSKTHLVDTKLRDPISGVLTSVDRILELRENGLNIVGVGFTIYCGSQFDHVQMEQAHHLVQDAHRAGLIAVLWMYPRGAAVAAEKDAHLIAGAAGVAACMGSDFTKVNPPKAPEGKTSAQALREAVRAAGRCGLICAGGSTTDGTKFLAQLYDQIHVGGAVGNATGRNIHQRTLPEALRLCAAISAITVGDKDVDFAVRVAGGDETWTNPKPRL